MYEAVMVQDYTAKEFECQLSVRMLQNGTRKCFRLSESPPQSVTLTQRPRRGRTSQELQTDRRVMERFFAALRMTTPYRRGKFRTLNVGLSMRKRVWKEFCKRLPMRKRV